MGRKVRSCLQKKWTDTCLDLEPTSHIIEAFKQLGRASVAPLTYISAVEEFVCKAYSRKTPTTQVAELRWELFRTCNKEGEQLPPTLDTLIPHLQRAHVITQIAKGYTDPHPEILPLVGNGWEETSPGVVMPIMCLSLPAPQAALALTKCGCKTPCSKAKGCSCCVEDLPCTGLCKCCECPNTRNTYGDDSDGDADDDIAAV